MKSFRAFLEESNTLSELMWGNPETTHGLPKNAALFNRPITNIDHALKKAGFKFKSLSSLAYEYYDPAPYEGTFTVRQVEEIIKKRGFSFDTVTHEYGLVAMKYQKVWRYTYSGKSHPTHDEKVFIITDYPRESKQVPARKVRFEWIEK